MSGLVTEARVELYYDGTWHPYGGPTRPMLFVPEAVDEGREVTRIERCFGAKPESQLGIRPVRVIDSAGTVVAQWGRP